MMHVDYLGDSGSLPAGTRLERVLIQCPPRGKPGHKLTVEVEGGQYQIVIPAAAKPGQDFEVAIPIPFTREDEDEEDEGDDGNFEYPESAGPAIIHNEDSPREMATTR